MIDFEEESNYCRIMIQPNVPLVNFHLIKTQTHPRFCHYSTGLGRCGSVQRIAFPAMVDGCKPDCSRTSADPQSQQKGQPRDT